MSGGIIIPESILLIVEKGDCQKMRKAKTVTDKRLFEGVLHDIKINKSLYLLAIPIIIYFFIFNYLPMFGLSIAFEDFNPTLGVFKSEWVGFDNFIKFFSSPNFFTVLRNTLVISSLGIFIGFPLSIIFALLINELKQVRFKKTVQTMSYLPYFISMVVIAGLIIEFCSTNGVITDFLVKVLHIKRENLLLNPNYFWAINLLSDIWQGVGYGSIIFIAAIAGINQELYEAAVIDGAGRFRRVLYITLPSILPTIIIMLVLRLGMIMQVGLDKILLLYNPSIYSTADVISTHIQRLGIGRMQYGYSAAVGLFNSVIGTLLLLVSNTVMSKLTDTSII